MKIVSYETWSGLERTISVYEIPVREAPKYVNDYLYQLDPKRLEEIWVIRGNLYYASSLETHEEDMRNATFTAAEAVHWNFPWHMIEREDLDFLREVHEPEIWAEALELRRQEKADREKAKRINAERQEEARRQERERRQKHFDMLKQGYEAVRYKMARVPVEENGALVKYDGYDIVLAEDTNQGTGFAVYKNKYGTWCLTHIATGKTITNTHSEKRKEVMAIAGALYNLWPIWNHEDPVSRLTAEDERQLKNLVGFYYHNGAGV